MSYEYVVLAPGERLYDDKTVQAKYIKSKISSDNGNPYIEALPSPRNKDEVFNDYTKLFTNYNKREQLLWNDYEKLALITTLRQIRFVLPFHNILENEFYITLLNSYRERQNGSFAANSGITLLGCSGCGKSTAVETLLSNYPQVIIHENDEMSKFTQIVYLVIECPTNSNFTALYTSIGIEIDKALGYDKPIYEKMIIGKRSLAEKAEVVCKLINLFNIGCIIFDEIQLINFNSNKENTYEGLLNVVNKTKVALMIVGTKDAYDKMFTVLRTARRTGTYINANSYCTDKNYFSAILTQLWRYQWFDKNIELNTEIMKALYEVTKGIIDQLISIYMYMQIDYILASKKPIIDARYVYYISEKYFPGMKKLLASGNNLYNHKEIEELKINAKEYINEILQQEEGKRIINEYSSPDFLEKMQMRNNIIINIKETLKVTREIYNNDKIEKAVDFILGVKRNKELDEAELTARAYKYLKSKKSDRRPKTKKHIMSDKELDDRIKDSI